MSNGKVVLGALAGLAVGAIVGILVAPDKGSRTRDKIKTKGDDYVEDMKHKFDKFYNSLVDKFQDTKNDAEKLAEKGKDKYDDAKREVKNAASEFKHTVS